jgi:short-subunit dehydrogenase
MSGKTVLLTGASRGIGRALSFYFAENGYNLIMLARNKKKLEALSKKIKNYNKQSRYYCLDPESVRNIKYNY